ncbi:reverse transcriptase, partial [Thalictrum thalictroides]
MDLKVSILGLLETKVKQVAFERIRNICCPGWSFYDNYSKHPAGRIWLCWNANEVEVTKLEDSMQHIHCKERIGRSLVHPSEIAPLSVCLQQAGLVDLNYSGFFFTWSNHSEGPARISSKIDRCLINNLWSSQFVSQAEFLPQGISDHSPALLSWFDSEKKAFPFRFNNAWCLIPGFKELVAETWNARVYANPMQVLILKQKVLKARLKSWARAHCSMLHDRVRTALEQLENFQKQLQTNPTDVSLCRMERNALKKYCNLAEAEYYQIKQKADCDWLTMGDRTTAYFHQAVKERKNRKAIRTMEDRNGYKLNTEAEIISEILDYYKGLFGEEDCEIDAEAIRDINFPNLITEEEKTSMIADVESQEIKSVLFAMGDNKSPVAVLEKVQKLCVKFLWSGPAMANALHQANVKSLTLSKLEGGLGITDMIKWSKAAYMGLVFKLVNAENSLWAQWSWTQHLRGKFFWTAKVPKDCSWVWRHILNSRAEAMKYINYNISNGRNTLLWHDPWCEFSPLIECADALAEWQQKFPLDTKVEVLITDGKWNQEVRMLQCSNLKQ